MPFNDQMADLKTMSHATKMAAENLVECENVKRLFLREKERVGMTHETLGKMIGKSNKTISAIVNGKTRVTVPVARKLAKVFGVPVVDILPWVSELDSDVSKMDLMEDFQNLTDENKEVARRMVRSLLDSQ